MEQVILSTIRWHIQDSQVIRPSQNVFMKHTLYLANLIPCDKITHLVDKGNAVEIVYLGFNKVFDTISCQILLEKLAAHNLNVGCIHWIKIWLYGQAQRVVVNRVQVMASH